MHFGEIKISLEELEKLEKLLKETFEKMRKEKRLRDTAEEKKGMGSYPDGPCPRGY